MNMLRIVKKSPVRKCWALSGLKKDQLKKVIKKRRKVGRKGE